MHQFDCRPLLVCLSLALAYYAPKVIADTGRNASDFETLPVCVNPFSEPEAPADLITAHWQARRADNLYAMTESVIVVTLLGANDQPFNTTNVTTTYGLGDFTLRLPRNKDFSIRFETSGYAGFKYTPIILRNFTHKLTLGSEVFMEPLLFIRESLKGIGNAAGTVRLVNPCGAYSVSGVQVQLRAGLNNVTGPVAAATTTTANGTWSAALPGGHYTATAVYTASKTGDKFTGPPFTVLAVPGGWNNLRDWALTPQFAKGDIRIILRGTGLQLLRDQFGPVDMKLVVSGPLQNSSSQRAEVRQNITISADKLMVYDYMDRIFGSVLIRKQLSGVYRIQVQDTTAIQPKPVTFKPNSNLDYGQAMVEIYRGDTLWGQYFVPLTSGNTWTVAEIDGSRLTGINKMSTVKYY
ncbi:uncharacterized protein LOC129600563 [Paramacrobiotus metropolitanus]|uniref:uncharacterized protein LOC129600563 n=1 Tax=Paramacrobiotus metropolitanus TaxID=2943436 RepID=UPI002445FAB6|nr:uncharacterized protein LOC129600563 [Paramacrobiotus metropolitanus]